MGLKSRRKGAAGERELVSLAKQHGLEAARTWSTAQHPDPAIRCSDVLVAGQPYQVKRQRDGFGALYDDLEHVAGLFIRADDCEWLVVLRADDFLKLLGEKEARRGEETYGRGGVEDEGGLREAQRLRRTRTQALTGIDRDS